MPKDRPQVNGRLKPLEPILRRGVFLNPPLRPVALRQSHSQNHGDTPATSDTTPANEVSRCRVY
jgi:hypothetical protein